MIVVLVGDQVLAFTSLCLGFCFIEIGLISCMFVVVHIVRVFVCVCVHMFSDPFSYSKIPPSST